MKLLNAVILALASAPLSFARPSFATTIESQATNMEPRQTIPSGYSYGVVGYPQGCGGTGEQYWGSDQDLAACTAINGLGSGTTWSSMKFEAPSNYKLRLFSGSDCTNEILLQNTDISQCFDVPEGQTCGAWIVYT